MTIYSLCGCVGGQARPAKKVLSWIEMALLPFRLIGDNSLVFSIYNKSDDTLYIFPIFNKPHEKTKTNMNWFYEVLYVYPKLDLSY